MAFCSRQAAPWRYSFSCTTWKTIGDSKARSSRRSRACNPHKAARGLRNAHLVQKLLSCCRRSPRSHSAPPVRCIAIDDGPSGLAEHDSFLDIQKLASQLVPIRHVIGTHRYSDGLCVEVAHVGHFYEVDVWADVSMNRMLHWGVNTWEAPEQRWWPNGSTQVDDTVVQSPFVNGSHVHLRFDAATCPSSLCFVIKEVDDDSWVNNDGMDYIVQLKAPNPVELTDQILDAESTRGGCSIHQRMKLLNELLDSAEQAGPEGMAFVFTWLCCSTDRQLQWYRDDTFHIRDMSQLQKVVAQRVAEKAAQVSDGWVRTLCRSMLAVLPRGGGDGDGVVDALRGIMTDNGIATSDHEDCQDPFLEQWLHKLQTASSPDDIIICEAYLAYQYSNSMEEYYSLLAEKGHISRAMLHTMDSPIKAEPRYRPHLTPSFQHMLWLLKTVHMGPDLDTALEMCKDTLDDDLRWHMYDVLANRSEWWVPGKMVDMRRRLKDYWKAPVVLRDVMMLDVALESCVCSALRVSEVGSLKGDDYVELITLGLRNASISSDDGDILACRDMWEKLRVSQRWSRDWCLRALAAARTTSLMLTDYMDTLYSLVKPATLQLHSACSLPPRYGAQLGSDTVLRHPLAPLSPLLNHFESVVQQTLGGATWQVCSHAFAQGYVAEVKRLSDIQGYSFSVPTILLTPQVDPNFDIPAGVTGIVSAGWVDVLSPVALRARSMGALMVAGGEDKQYRAMRSMKDVLISLRVSNSGTLDATALDPSESGDDRGGYRAGGRGLLPHVSRPTWTRSSEVWAVRDVDFEMGIVSQTWVHMTAIKSQLPAWIQVPSSIALPFGTFQRVLAHPVNQQTAWTLSKLTHELEEYGPHSGIPPTLSAIRDLVTTFLKAPEDLRAELSFVGSQAGLISRAGWKNESDWAAVWSAVCKVWASKWSDGAWMCRRLHRVDEQDVEMAAIIQQVPPADYSFVVRTCSAHTGLRGGVSGEVLPGLGENMVGSFPGEALSFAITSRSTKPHVVSFPSKRAAWFTAPQGDLLVRPVSNAEEISHFGGAPVYDSVLVNTPLVSSIDYTSELLMWDDEFREQLLDSIALLGLSVEAAFRGVPQEVHGVWAAGQLCMVDCRPLEV